MENVENTENVKKKRMSKDEYTKILDEANAVKLYLEEGWNQEQISKKFGVSKGSVANYLKNIKNIQVRAPKKREELRNTYPIGTKFGLWTIISDEIKVGSNRGLYQLCQCVCGETQWKALTALRAGTTTRCKKCGNKTFINDNGEININALILSFYKHIQNSLKSRKKVSQLGFDITPEYLEELYEKQNHKCAISGLPLEIDLTKRATEQPWSLDRIDSNKGYVKGNVQWVDKRVNMMKQSYDQEDFIKICSEIAKNKCD